MPRGHAYLCAVMDWHSRKVLGWSLSSTMGTALCLETLEMALNSTGKIPEIFNTDQGCQFTSAEKTRQPDASRSLSAISRNPESRMKMRIPKALLDMGLPAPIPGKLMSA